MLIDNKDILIEEIKEIKEDLRYCGFINGSKISVGFETTKEIQNIVKSDEVLSYDIEYQRYELCTVSETYVKNVDKVYVINKNIISGGSQKFYVKNFGWKKANQLSFDDNIVTNSGDLVVADIEIRYGEYVLYDLTVEKTHNFLVNGSLVHNQINVSATPTTTITSTNTPTTTPTLTITPTITPTTRNPTEEPTTTNPTEKPTAEPTTLTPTTANPTTNPTGNPTAKPTTATPTTAKPIVPATKNPTRKPSAKPTTVKPTTAKPTAKPTTAKPTAKPTTAKPTIKPTRKPTTKPTTQ